MHGPLFHINYIHDFPLHKSIMEEHSITTVNKFPDVLPPLSGRSLSSIHLPQITVVRSQSSVKPYILKNIIGRNFLPRAAGIIIRTPLVLQIIN